MKDSKRYVFEAVKRFPRDALVRQYRPVFLPAIEENVWPFGSVCRCMGGFGGHQPSYREGNDTLHGYREGLSRLPDIEPLDLSSRPEREFEIGVEVSPPV